MLFLGFRIVGVRVSGGHLYGVEAPTEAAAEKRVSGGHLYGVEAPTEAAAEIGALAIPPL